MAISCTRKFLLSRYFTSLAIMEIYLKFSKLAFFHQLFGMRMALIPIHETYISVRVWSFNH